MLVQQTSKIVPPSTSLHVLISIHIYFSSCASHYYLKWVFLYDLHLIVYALNQGKLKSSLLLLIQEIKVLCSNLYRSTFLPSQTTICALSFRVTAPAFWKTSGDLSRALWLHKCHNSITHKLQGYLTRRI